ncbi:hypothetical protein CDCA_CDCA01G0224 [Cyanidium caldarium]|uniref:FAS1 domain-containing protein n=1 Tax=Cyanidium caldarium TaxID=2771 RepID=A0AAV9IPX1_CYACA|nr:hypothetical protein CDCA_CDCA01G0224 [Cyanidium caldarium]
MKRSFVAILSAVCWILFALLSATRPLHAQSLSEVEREHPDISTFVTLTNETLGSELSTIAARHETITVFAPDNSAFDALPHAVLDRLHTNHTLLKDVLLNHILRGNITAHDLLGEGLIEAKTLYDNSSVLINATNTSITVDGNKVITPDVFFDLGVIHIIDGVLVPTNLRHELLG